MNNLKEITKRLPGYNKLKAGIIPYYADGTALFFISSNAEYGGIDPSIAKGRIDKGETPIQAAVREGAEELGLKKSNFLNTPFLVWSGSVAGMAATYEMSVFAVEVKSKNDFSQAGSETGSTVWLDLNTQIGKVRDIHQPIVKSLVSFLKKSPIKSLV